MNSKTVVIALDKKHDAGELDHINVWIRKWGLTYSNSECRNNVWYFYDAENIPEELPQWVEVR